MEKGKFRSGDGLCAPVKIPERAASHPHDAGRNSTVQQERKARP